MDEKYNNLLGVSSHELYHTWTIKSIRPIEMLPYNYSKENYFRTGYVAEGVTTYMGDLMLYKSDVIDWNKFIATRNKNLEQHLMNYGRFNLSVADSGFDNWLDGYKLGAPNRKVSIYPDGALCMMMMDLQIIYNSNGQESLNSVMKELYINFGLKKIGYSDSDFINICLRYGGEDVKKIFKNHIYGTEDYIPTLKNKLKLIGLELEESKNPNLCAQFFGFVVVKENNRFIIKKVELNSCSDKAKIAPEDEIISINGQKITGKLSDLLEDCTDKIEVTIKKKFSAMNITLQIGNFYKLLKIKESKNVSKEQLDLRKFWSK